MIPAGLMLPRMLGWGPLPRASEGSQALGPRHLADQGQGCCKGSPLGPASFETFLGVAAGEGGDREAEMVLNIVQGTGHPQT